jgi:hypothetical protein
MMRVINLVSKRRGRGRNSLSPYARNDDYMAITPN